MAKGQEPCVIVDCLSVCLLANLCSVQLHNQLLTSLLHNASSPLVANAFPSPLTLNKRRKGGMDAADFDSDSAFAEPRQRVQYWVMGMGGKERDRVRRAVEQGEEEGAEPAVPETDLEMVNGRKRKWTLFNSSKLKTIHQYSFNMDPSAHTIGRCNASTTGTVWADYPQCKPAWYPSDPGRKVLWTGCGT
jgi:hypothetical protein